MVLYKKPNFHFWTCRLPIIWFPQWKSKMGEFLLTQNSHEIVEEVMLVPFSWETKSFTSHKFKIFIDMHGNFWSVKIAGQAPICTTICNTDEG